MVSRKKWGQSPKNWARAAEIKISAKMSKITISRNLLFENCYPIAPSWEPLSSVSELVEALMAWQTLDQLIHPAHYGTNVIVWIVKKVKYDMILLISIPKTIF